MPPTASPTRRAPTASPSPESPSAAPPARVGAPLAGAYGSLVLGANGAYVYTLNNQSGAVQALGVGETLTETFTYTITDGDGDVRSTTLTITINGTNDVPTIVAGRRDACPKKGLRRQSRQRRPAERQLEQRDRRPASSRSATSMATRLTVTARRPGRRASRRMASRSAGRLSSDGHVLTGSAGGAAVVTVTVANNGAYTVVLSGQVDHPNAGGEDIVAFGDPGDASATASPRSPAR